MSTLLQNAVRVKTSKGYVYHRSVHVHDYQEHGRGKKRFSIDGGNAYVRRGANDLTNPPFEEWCLTEDDSFETICARALWGSYGKDGKGPKVIKPLAECDFDHLCAIKATQPQIKGTMWGRVVDYWIKEKA